jgi:hypothetical protein
MLSWKWWNFKEMYLVHGLKFDSVVASNTLEGNMVELKALVEMASVHFVGRLIKECAMTLCNTRRRGRISLAAVDKAM